MHTGKGATPTAVAVSLCRTLVDLAATLADDPLPSALVIPGQSKVRVSVEVMAARATRHHLDPEGVEKGLVLPIRPHGAIEWCHGGTDLGAKEIKLPAEIGKSGKPSLKLGNNSSDWLNIDAINVSTKA
jgi:hypothetical protein